MDELTLELARFFVAAWNAYGIDASGDIISMIEESPLVEEHTATEEDVEEDDLPEGVDESNIDLLYSRSN